MPVGVSPWLFGYAGLPYGLVALAGGLLFAVSAWKLYKAPDEATTARAAKSLFGYSILYLVLLFAVLLVDRGFGWSFGYLPW